MATRQIVVDVPEKIFLAEKMNETDSSRELKTLAAMFREMKAHALKTSWPQRC